MSTASPSVDDAITRGEIRIVLHLLGVDTRDAFKTVAVFSVESVTVRTSRFARDEDGERIIDGLGTPEAVIRVETTTRVIPYSGE